jgi:hypothetical protein
MVRDPATVTPAVVSPDDGAGDPATTTSATGGPKRLTSDDCEFHVGRETTVFFML